ncbi:GNAT family N-acetyltransferase [Brevibacillus invocatus]|uniref:GNAT family N-acetyltransferase n=1 Tax=Brevibacillus invocatus TaxID=173959 RepID=UPI00203A4974|nr:GNAT family N-acetyltransferase [Brevibacillus invocatus]MCM3078319.1 GNAT family N-acetyltransferase [Brevibacillus invocatus]MCM3428526.1 GNAT family N-acetyltransferase [Brevibacillus invocatus]
MKPELEYAIVTSATRMNEIEDLQRQIWGESSVIPVAQLLAASHNGGVVIAAYHGDVPVGYCYGFSGFKQGKSHLCSHMLGILPAYRDWGIGRRLKLLQREWALDYGYETITWTYDPLEARNAYLNLSKLGGKVRHYMESYYGEMRDCINKGLPSDRFLLEWELNSKRAVMGIEGRQQEESAWRSYPRLIDWEYDEQKQPRPLIREGLGEHTGILLSVPSTIHSIKQEHLEVALEWRLALRNMCKSAFTLGYTVIGVLKTEEPVHAYVLEKIVEGEM